MTKKLETGLPSCRAATIGMAAVLTFFVMVTLSGAGCAEARKDTKMKPASEMEQAISTLRAAYAAFNRGDMDAAVKGLDPQIEWSEPVEFPGGGMYHGRDAVRGYLTRSRAGWAEGSSEPEQFIAAGNRIVVFVHARFRLKGGKDWNDVKLADVYTIRKGQIVAMRAFANRQEALRWVGVESSTGSVSRGSIHKAAN